MDSNMFLHQQRNSCDDDAEGFSTLSRGHKFYRNHTVFHHCWYSISIYFPTGRKTYMYMKICGGGVRISLGPSTCEAHHNNYTHKTMQISVWIFRDENNNDEGWWMSTPYCQISLYVCRIAVLAWLLQRIHISCPCNMMIMMMWNHNIRPVYVWHISWSDMSLRLILWLCLMSKPPFSG